MVNSILFASVNTYKHHEATTYAAEAGIVLNVAKISANEIISTDLRSIVASKCLDAFRQIREACAVEHGGLYIESLGWLPGGLSKPFWDTLDGHICDLIPALSTRSAIAKSVVGYCDGRRVHLFEGETAGAISDHARGSYAFQWDPIFVPDGASETFAEMGFPAKSEYSQAAKAWRALFGFLRLNAIH